MSLIGEKKAIIVKQDGPVVTVTLNRPERLNAFNNDMFSEIAEMADSVSGNSDVRVIVFTGTGRGFSSGADLANLNSSQVKAPAGASAPGDAMKAGLLHAQSVFDKVEALPQPTIAAINGHAVGAGLQLTLACDFRIAVTGIKMGLSDTKIGIIPALGATTRLPALIGLARAREMVVGGELITPEKACDFGLLTRLVEPGGLDEAVKEQIDTLLSRAPLAMAAAKDLLNNSASLEKTAEAQSNLFKTNDAREGISSFLEKRKPDFKGN